MSERNGNEPRLKRSTEFRRSRKRLTSDLLLHEEDFNAYIDDAAIERAACSCGECMKTVQSLVDIRYPAATPANKDRHVGEYVKQALREAPLKREIRVWEKGLK